MKAAISELGLAQSEQNTLDEFFRCVNLCHDCISIADERDKSKVVFNGPSVDEVCLLEMAADSGISNFATRDSDSCSIVLNGK